MNYRSLAAHNAKCNPIFYRFQDCEKEHPYGKFLGYCQDIQKEMNKCIKQQLEIHRKENQQRQNSKSERKNITGVERNN